MSFVMPSSRSYEHPPPPQQQSQPPTSDDHSSINQNGRTPMPNTSFTYPPVPIASSAQPHQPPFPSDHRPVTLPKVGQTRCYWTLLSADLQFIYLDPVLASHLEGQAEDLIGKSLLAFVHPDEQRSAKQDLGSMLETRTLHGSVTRVRFSRLSRVRRQLGYEGPPAPWTDADKIALDANYMAVDIVTNWAAEGLVLCFIHAIVDLNPDDNDEQNKTGWTNWCGTPSMEPDQVDLLYRRLMQYIPQNGSMTRVFQILSNRPGRPLLMNWPPDQGQGPTGRDFAKVVEDAKFGTGIPSDNDAKTSCTRRYKAYQPMQGFTNCEVESIFIPHGTVIFACHKVYSPSRSTATSTATMQQMGYHPPNYNPQQTTAYYEQGGSYALPPLSSSSAPYGNYVPQSPQSAPAPYSPQRWNQGTGEQQAPYNHWSSPSPAHPNPPLPPTGPSSAYMDGSANPPQGFNRSLSPAYAYSPTAGGSEGASPTADLVPPPRRRVSPGSTREQYGPGGRSAGNRPMGILKCSSCKATSSPEWRKGPSGKKELCNACGLRYARSRAKKEGHNATQRRRKDKGLAKRDSATPPTSASPSYAAMRRSYGDTSFVSTSSTGSGSGSEIYGHSGHHVLDNMTPSPSPPSSHMSFVHYAPGPENRHTYSNNTSNFYSVPSPLSNPPVLHPQQQGNQLPPLGQMAAYADRLSPMVPSTSPIAHSSLSTSLAPASFERERDRDRELRELPPTPVSAEPRQPRRSLLSQQ